MSQGECNKALVEGKLTGEKITRRLVRNRPTNGVTRAELPEKGREKKEADENLLKRSRG